MSDSKRKIKIINPKGDPFTSKSRAERFVSTGQAVWAVRDASIQFLPSAGTMEKNYGYDASVSRGSIATRAMRQGLPVAGDPDALIRAGGMTWYAHGWDKSVHRHKRGSSQHAQ